MCFLALNGSVNGWTEGMIVLVALICVDQFAFKL
jgi:hypothetical protein